MSDYITDWLITNWLISISNTDADDKKRCQRVAGEISGSGQGKRSGWI